MVNSPCWRLATTFTPTNALTHNPSPCAQREGSRPDARVEVNAPW